MLTSLTIRLKKHSAELLIVATFAMLWFCGQVDSESRFTKYKLSSSSGSFTSTSAAPTWADVTNLSLSFKTTGRPVLITLINDSTSSTADSASAIGCNSGAASCDVYFAIDRGGSVISKTNLVDIDLNGNTPTLHVPCSSLSYVDVPAAGTYTYKIKTFVTTGTARVISCKLMIYELP